MSQVLASLSDALAETVESAGQHVVRVEGRQRLPASGVVWSADGVIVTAHHVLEQDENIQVGLADGQTLAASLVGRDPSTDLAVLQVPATGLDTPTWAEPDDLKVGHLALALGRPGQGVRATLGILSALGQSWRTPTVRRVVETLLAHGHIRRVYLGIGAQPIQLPEAIGQQLNQETGLLLVSVETDSPAEAGKLFLSDTLLSLLSGDQVGTLGAGKHLAGRPNSGTKRHHRRTYLAARAFSTPGPEFCHRDTEARRISGKTPCLSDSVAKRPRLGGRIFRKKKSCPIFCDN
jgi:S1-C subfamily serine protease